MQSSIAESGLEWRLSTRDPALQYSGIRESPERLPQSQAAQPAHAARRRSGDRDRADFPWYHGDDGSPDRVGGAADAQAVGPHEAVLFREANYVN
jgi:hypothetical protein